MISTNLLALREVNKYTQEEVAEKIGVSRQAVAKWENGDSLPGISGPGKVEDDEGITGINEQRERTRAGKN